MTIRESLSEKEMNENKRLIHSAVLCLKKLQSNIMEKIEYEDIGLNEKMSICISMLLSELPMDESSAILNLDGEIH